MKRKAYLVYGPSVNCANGIVISSPLFVSLDCWNYFTKKLHQHQSFVGRNFEPSMSLRTARTFHDLSSQAFPFPTDIFVNEADNRDQFECPHGIFGTSYIFGVRRPRDTRKVVILLLQ